MHSRRPGKGRRSRCGFQGRGAFSAGWQFVIPDFGTVEGPFQITALEYSGAHDGEVAFEIALESAGQVSFETA